MNKAAKNIKVLHSTRAKIPSKSFVSASMRIRKTPNKVVHPSDKLTFGKLCKKKSIITNINVILDFNSSHLSRIGY